MINLPHGNNLFNLDDFKNTYEFVEGALACPDNGKKRKGISIKEKESV